MLRVFIGALVGVLLFFAPVDAAMAKAKEYSIAEPVKASPSDVAARAKYSWEDTGQNDVRGESWRVVWSRLTKNILAARLLPRSFDEGGKELPREAEYGFLVVKPKPPKAKAPETDPDVQPKCLSCHGGLPGGGPGKKPLPGNNGGTTSGGSPDSGGGNPATDSGGGSAADTGGGTPADDGRGTPADDARGAHDGTDSSAPDPSSPEELAKRMSAMLAGDINPLQALEWDTIDLTVYEWIVKPVRVPATMLAVNIDGDDVRKPAWAYLIPYTDENDPDQTLYLKVSLKQGKNKKKK